MPVPQPESPDRQLRCCSASGCRSAGGEALLAALRTARDADATDGLTIKPVGCLRLCGRGPLVACDGPEGTRLYGAVPPEHAADLLAAAQAGEAAATAALEPHRLDLDHPFFARWREWHGRNWPRIGLFLMDLPELEREHLCLWTELLTHRERTDDDLLGLINDVSSRFNAIRRRG